MTDFYFDAILPGRIGGWLLFIGIAGVVLLTIWTYMGVRGASFSRVLIILTLRLLALLVAVTLMLRPTFATYKREDAPPSKLIVLVDDSGSMQFLDEFDNKSRWENVHRILNAPGIVATLKELSSKHKVEVIYYQGAETVRKLNPDGKADGKRTDVWQWLDDLLTRHRRDTEVRALAIFSDGANNGPKKAFDRAADWRNDTSAPLHTFGAGKPTTTIDHGDLAFVNITAPPSVPVKGTLKVVGEIDAAKFINSQINVQLFLDDKPAFPEPVKQVQLTRTRGNLVEITCDAPTKPGEVKVTLKVDTLPNEVTDFNNEISTYVNVTKDGVSILWVEGKKRAFESVFALRHAISKDPRFRVFYTERLREAAPVAIADDWFNFARQHYDVIVIGDISATRFAGGNAKVFGQIKDMVQNKGTGLMMMGGYETFANSDWHTLAAASDLVSLLPVKLTATPKEQVEGQVFMVPSPESKEHYLLRLADDAEKNRILWLPKPGTDEVGFAPLDGMTHLGELKAGATIFATRDGTEPILVGGRAGEGRVLAFGGDTTWKAWRRAPETLPGYERFWRQTMLWLARQEEIEGNVWVKLDRRRLPADANQRLGFSVGIQGKGGVSLKNAQYQVKVLQPSKEETPVAVTPEGGEERGGFFPRQVGEYRIEVTGSARDADGSEVRGTARARFLAYAEDLEKMRPAADHEFLEKLSAAGGGAFHRAVEGEFNDFLKSLVRSPKLDHKGKPELWPDWRRNPPSNPRSVIESFWGQMGALWNSAALFCFVAFTSLLCLEWFLRRRWGLV